MKKFNLSKELLLNGILIGVLSIGLASCGGGGGGGSGSTSLSFGGSSSSTPTSPVGSSSSTPLSYSLAAYLYAGTDHFNEPIITVYIDGKPVKLLADTGHSGLVVNSSAVNIPSSDIYSSSTFIEFFHNDNYTLSGTMAIATVCLNPNPSITNSCVQMKIGLMSPNNAFPATGEAQGVFGLASGFNSLDSSGNITGYSYPTYLERQYGINSYTISFYSLTNGYYSDVSSTTPIGYISFGVYNGNSNTLIPYDFYNGSGQPKTIVVFPSSTSSTTSFAGYAIFDSGYRYNILSTSVFQIEIPNFNQGLDEGPCTTLPSNIVNGGYNIT
ncbi:MAG: Retroviral aspartyl protease, partial [Hydrogenobaculum sp.]